MAEEECMLASEEGCGEVIACADLSLDNIPSRYRDIVASAPIGNLYNRIVGDDIIYVYRSPSGAGFIVRAHMRGLAAGECGPRLREHLVPAVDALLRDDPRLVFLHMVIEEKMLR